MKVYEKLAAIQQTINVPKGQDNTFAGFKYRSAEDILEKLKPLLKERSVIVILSDEVVAVAEQAYVKATAVFKDLESDDSAVAVSAYAREERTRPKMSEGQLTGAASSYARKYALNGLLLLDDNKDPDSQDNPPKAPVKPTAQPTAAAPDELTAAKSNLQRVLKSYGHDNDVKMKALIHKVLRKSKVDTIDEVNEVLLALEEGLV